jgi:hypothetical protein
MKRKLAIFIVLVVFAIIFYNYGFGNIAENRGHPENIDAKSLFKIATNLEKEAEGIVAKSELVNELVDGRNKIKLATIIYNENIVEFIYGVEGGKKCEIVHDWIVFVKTPPNPAKLNTSELLKFGVETPLIYRSCNYYVHGSFVIVNRSLLEGLHE